MERDNFEIIERLIKNRLFNEAENNLNSFSNQVMESPSYAGYYWLAKSFHCVNKKKYALKTLENVDLAITKLPSQSPIKELPATVLLLKARALSYLEKFDLGIDICNNVIDKKKDAEAYFVRGALKFKLKDEEGGFEDLKNAEGLGNKEATIFLHNRNNKKRK